MRTREEMLDELLADMRRNVHQFIADTAGADRMDYLSRVVRQGCRALGTQSSVTNQDLFQLAQACIHFALEMTIRHESGQGGVEELERPS